MLVIDLQDVGTRVYTYIYTMANCMRAAARHGVRVVVCDRPNPVGGEAIEGATLLPEYASFVGQYPDSDAPRHDDRRARAALQRCLRPQRRARRRPARGTGAGRCTSTRPGCPGSSLPEHSDARQRHRLSGGGAVRRNDAVGGTRHDEAVRADRRAVDRRRPAGRGDERARAPRRALPLRLLRADVPEAREADLRRLPDPRARPEGLRSRSARPWN